ncbi:MAG: hypothetical protein A2Y62_03405 [Candidatus Fischerbacteria bacterium RBG_13_37_8]|uniref:Sigma-54 factor interaction domain-containing protein n=1 Tax=Candidatus Fischerbacteria bacterium RBG_13_37_8 TaxID=1817863 RepID=A0A1F5VJX2_9BACT|nr:MAG: hypothetical protein A2Y62_03405 [Candidatus Fischerbacteria bacterium RBG_13_37_8]
MNDKKYSNNGITIIDYNETKKLAEVIAKYDISVLLTGETGVGKNLFAHYIHEQSNRCKKKFYQVSCPNLQPSLFETVFYGHKKGSFTDAKEDREGALEIANGGTQFLDEIGELNLELQSKMLSVVEERTFRRIGEKEERSTDIRIIYATNENLKEMVKKGLFRRIYITELTGIRLRYRP